MELTGSRKSAVDEILGDGEAAQEKGSESLKVIAEELIDSVHAKDVDGVVSALKAAFEELDKPDEPKE